MRFVVWEVWQFSDAHRPPIWLNDRSSLCLLRRLAIHLSADVIDDNDDQADRHWLTCRWRHRAMSVQKPARPVAPKFCCPMHPSVFPLSKIVWLKKDRRKMQIHEYGMLWNETPYYSQSKCDMKKNKKKINDKKIIKKIISLILYGIQDLTTVQRWYFVPARQWFELFQLSPLKDQYSNSLRLSVMVQISPRNLKIS